MTDKMLPRDIVEKMLEGRNVSDDLIQERLGTQQEFTRNEMMDIMEELAHVNLEQDMRRVAGKSADKKRGWKGKKGGAKSFEEVWKEELRIRSIDENIDPATAHDLARDRAGG